MPAPDSTDPSLVDRTIAELRAGHDQLTEVVAGLDRQQLTGPSGADDWTVADVLSHLGSGAEITRRPVLAALGADDGDASVNEAIWDRWNAMAPADQASGFVGADETLVATLEALTPEQRATFTIDLGFLPQPVPLATALGMRLNEAALHTWDIRIALDPAATLSDEAAALLATHYAETMAFLVGFIGKPGDVEPAVVAVGEHAIVLDADGVRFAAIDDAGVPTAAFGGSTEAAIRLVTGRLKPPYVPDGVEVTGNVSLADLQQVFPGY